MPSALRLVDRGLLPVLLAVPSLWAAARWPLWDAEMWTARACMLPFWPMLSAVAADKHPPLFFVLEWVLWRVHGSPFVLRLPAIAAAVATVAVVQDLGERHFGAWTGRFAALLLACSPYLVAYAANARSVTFTGLIGAIALAATLDLVRGDRPDRAALWLGGALTVGMYVHYAVSLAVAGAALALVLGLARSRAHAGRAAAAVIVPVLAFLPWALTVARAQHIAEAPVARTIAVWRFLLWPVGPDYVAPGAGVMLVLAAIGLVRAIWLGGPAIAGWVAAALASAWLWSADPFTVQKLYLEAPAQPVFALLAGVALSGIARPGGRAVVVAVLVAAASLPGLRDALVPASNLVSVAPLAPGVYDTRKEAEALASLRLAHELVLVPEARSAQDWAFYEPILGRPPMRPAPLWRAVAREDGRLARLRREAGAGCVLTEAFSAYLVVPDAGDCAVLRDTLAQIGSRDAYGPFLLEIAAQEPDPDRAVALARAAADPVSARPELLLARLLGKQGRWDEALDAILAGEEKAARYRRRDEHRDLVALEIEAARHVERHGPLPAAKARQACLAARQRTLLERVCQDGWLSML